MMRRSLALVVAFSGSAFAQDVAETAKALALEAYASSPDHGEVPVSRYVECLGRTPHASDLDPRPWLLDALIRADADVPASALEPLFPAYPEQVIILLAKNPEASRESLLRLMDRRPAALQWLAMADILVSARLPGVAPRVLAGFELPAVVHVVQGAAIGVGGGDPERRKPEMTVRRSHAARAGWPPFVRYTLTDDPVRGDTFLAGVEHRVYYRRDVVRGDRVEILERSPTFIDSRSRLDCIAGLVGRKHLSPRAVLVVTFTSDEAYLDEVATFRKRLEKDYATMLDALRRYGALTEEELQNLNRLRIRWEVEDHFDQSPPPIPER